MKPNTKKNLSILIPSLGGGGAERVASNLSQYLHTHNYNIYIFTYSTNKNIKYNFCGKVINLIPYIDNSNKEQNTFQNITQLIHLIVMSRQVYHLKKLYKIDVSISFMEEFNLINILSRANDKIIIRICTILSARLEDQHGLYYNKLLLKKIYNKADAIVLMTQFAYKDMINNYGIKHKLISIIPNPISNTNYKANKYQPWIFGNNVILSIARLEEIKQQQHLIRAFSKIIPYQPDSKLLLVGSDTSNHAKYLKNLVKNLKLADKVIFIGHADDVSYYLNNSKVFVLTSKTEGFPNSLIEALASGLPVISADCPGAPREILKPGSIFNGSLQNIDYATYGILTPCLDGKKYSAYDKLTKAEYKLAKSIQSVICTKKIYNKYKNIGKKMVETNYSLDNVGKKWERLISNINQN